VVGFDVSRANLDSFQAAGGSAVEWGNLGISREQHMVMMVKSLVELSG